MKRPAIETLLLIAIMALATWLRVVHLGTPSLWWDELVHIRTAEAPLPEVLREVRAGIPPGTGNAGAMPLDYVLLHLYRLAVPWPGATSLEAYYRAPACLYAILAVPALYAVGRRLFGAAVGLVAAYLLALSLPHILYAAEARSYSLFVLMTIANLAAFAAVAASPRRRDRWLVYTAVNVAWFLTGAPALLLVVLQHLLLLGVGREAYRRVPVLLASGLAVALVVGAYWSGTALGTRYPREAWRTLDPWAVTWDGLRFLTGDSAVLRWLWVAGVPATVASAWRRGRPAIGLYLALCPLALLALAALIKWKHYYFHPRHGLFLLPLVLLTIAAGATEIVRALDPVRRPSAVRDAVRAALVAVAATAVVAGGIRTYLGQPLAAFARTKTLRDVQGLTRHLAAVGATLPPGERYLLIAERESTANALVDAYLRWYGLQDRVVLRSPVAPLAQVQAQVGAGGDPARLPLRSAIGLTPPLRRLLGIDAPDGVIPAGIHRHGFLTYGAPAAGGRVLRFAGCTLSEP